METEISRSIRHLAPAHYSMKVESFSSVSKIEKYESGVFEAGDYHWRLLFHPKGDKENEGQNHISLYLEIVMTDDLPVVWEVNVILKFFVHNQIEDNYLVIQDHGNGGVKRFNATKKLWGFAKLLPLKTFKDSSKGYIVRDSCLFGAEVVVLKHSGKWESVALLKAPNISNATFTWEIEKYSQLGKPSTDSAVFSVGERNWQLRMYPRGSKSFEGKFLSLYLIPSDWEWETQIERKAGVHAEYTLRVVDQLNGKHNESKCSYCFSSSDGGGYGFAAMVSLEDLNERSQGFIVKDSLTVEVEFLSITDTNYSDDIEN